MVGMTLAFMNAALSLVDMLSLQPPSVELGALAAGAAADASPAGAAAGASPAGAAAESAAGAAGSAGAGWLPPQAAREAAATKHERPKKNDERRIRNSSDNKVRERPR